MEAARDNLIFNLESWPEAGQRVDFALAPSTLSPYLEAAMTQDGDVLEGEPPQLLSSLRGWLSLDLFGRRLRLRGSFSVKVELTCHRCLALFEDKIGDTIEESVDLVAPGEEAADRETVVEVVDNHFDLTPLLCELLWLSWPMKVLCRPDCLGLCLSCGANLNEGLCSCGKTQRIRH
ncbi:MAG: DUF177 domain-containing protein [Deltaproteobacteria bacterium]|nr:DUF177 domain-containing protein [Deltaproteobacteria bacterium]